MKIPYDLERKLLKFCMARLMTFIVAATAMVYIVGLAMPNYDVFGLLSLQREPLLRGQVWRLITFVFVPVGGSPLTVAISLYFYWMIGTELGNRWGTVMFNLYYWCGMLGAIIAAMITGYANVMYLNLSMFFAFAILNPDAQFMMFFLIPIKAKYMAVLNALFLLVSLITGTWSTRLAILFSLINLFIFLGGDFITRVRRESQYWKTRRNFRKQMRK